MIQDERVERDEVLTRMHEAATFWSVGHVTAAELIDVACDLLVAGFDGLNLAMLAGVLVRVAHRRVVRADDAQRILIRARVVCVLGVALLRRVHDQEGHEPRDDEDHEDDGDRVAHVLALPTRPRGETARGVGRPARDPSKEHDMADELDGNPTTRSEEGGHERRPRGARAGA